MSKYDELRRFYIAQQDASRHYWESLQKKAAQITAGFSEYLGTEPKKYTDLDGKHIRYVQTRKHRGSEEVHFLQLDGADGAIHFDVAITLDEQPGAFPKSVVTIPLKIGKNDTSYVIWSDSIDIASSVDLHSEDCSELYGQMFNQLKAYLDTRPVLKLPF